jgi:hypothetical protein
LRALDLNQDRAPPSRACCHAAEEVLARSKPMLDVVMLAVAVVSFALLLGYVYACDQL